MNRINSCINILRTLKGLSLPPELPPLVDVLIKALENKNINKTVFALDELVCGYCLKLIDDMNIECPDVKNMHNFQKYQLAGKQHLLDDELYGIWEDVFYISSALCTTLDFEEKLSAHRIQDAYECIHRFSNYLIKKYDK